MTVTVEGAALRRRQGASLYRRCPEVARLSSPEKGAGRATSLPGEHLIRACDHLVLRAAQCRGPHRERKGALSSLLGIPDPLGWGGRRRGAREFILMVRSHRLFTRVETLRACRAPAGDHLLVGRSRPSTERSLSRINTAHSGTCLSSFTSSTRLGGRSPEIYSLTTCARWCFSPGATSRRRVCEPRQGSSAA